MLSKSQLQIILSKLKTFQNPKIQLEQYPTPSNIAAEMLTIAFISGNIEDKKIIDLGCGNGVLSLGASLLGAKEVYAFDIDKDALKIALENKKFLEKEFNTELKAEFFKKDINDLDLEKKFDLFIMNPPFGLQNKDINLVFLEKAVSLANKGYVLLHTPREKKTETREFYNNFMQKFNMNLSVFKTFEFNIPRTHKFHTKEKLKTEMDLYFVERI